MERCPYCGSDENFIGSSCVSRRGYVHGAELREEGGAVVGGGKDEGGKDKGGMG